MELTKRQFLKLSAATLLGLCVEGPLDLGEMASYAQEGPPPFLNDQERALFQAFINHLIPPDQDPGVLELGLAGMIETFLRVTPQARPLVKPGLKGLEESAKEMFGKTSFLQLSKEEKDRLLNGLRTGQVKGKVWEEVSATEFFNTVRMFTVGLYYSNPRVWRSIGYTGPAQPKGHPDYDRL